MLSPDVFLSLSSMNFLSKNGLSYSFDSRANGYSRGEGNAVIVLKRLSDAIANGDAIRAIIRYIGLPIAPFLSLFSGSSRDGH